MTLAAAMSTAAAAQEAPMAPLRPDQSNYLALYKELVETNYDIVRGQLHAGGREDCRAFAGGGFADRDITAFSVPEHPRDGGLVAVLPGSSKTAKPMLLLGHLDVVEARREDWTRDPFTLMEENGYFYGRGTADMKAMDAVWVDALIRFKQGGYRPKRTIKLALTCGEETTYAFNGAQWLAKNRPELISAAFALNEGGGGRTDGHGKVVVQSMQVGEKAVQNYRFETVNAGGHSSIPIRDNAIYELADALAKVRDHEFPVKFTETTRVFFAKAGAARGDDLGRAMTALAANPDDAAAEAIVSKDRSYHSMLRTTCVATLLEGGHANNALPQRAAANVNCPHLSGRDRGGHPGRSDGDCRRSRSQDQHGSARASRRGCAAARSEDFWSGRKAGREILSRGALIPSMSTGATDGIYLEAIGIPVYGVPGGWGDPDGNGAHGLNERRSVRSVLVGRDFLTDLVKLYADSG